MSTGPCEPAPGYPGGPGGGVDRDRDHAGDRAGDPEFAPATRGLVVVGPGASFGSDLLRRFGREGFALGVVSRSADTLTRVRDELAEDGLAVHGAVADVTDQPALTTAIQRVAADVGGLTVLVYNAKLSIRGGALTVKAETMNQTLAVNVTGALTAVQVAADLLVDRPAATIPVDHGRIAHRAGGRPVRAGDRQGRPRRPRRCGTADAGRAGCPAAHGGSRRQGGRCGPATSGGGRGPLLAGVRRPAWRRFPARAG